MINKLIKVTDNLYRGSAPTPKDVLWLKNHLHINKIISLDRESGEKINRTCKLLNIKQYKIYLDGSKKSLLKLLQHDLKKLLLDDGPTFVHCFAGKDRTGLVIAMFKCKYMNMDPDKAITEAKRLGFGEGIDPRITNQYEKLIRQSSKNSDNNSADIVSNEREYISDNRSSPLDEAHQGSFSPYLSQTKQNPIDAVYNYIDDQFPTRENYNRPINQKNIEKNHSSIPLIGIYNNDAGIHGAGPTEPVGGFIYD